MNEENNLEGQEQEVTPNTNTNKNEKKFKFEAPVIKTTMIKQDLLVNNVQFHYSTFATTAAEIKEAVKLYLNPFEVLSGERLSEDKADEIIADKAFAYEGDKGHLFISLEEVEA